MAAKEVYEIRPSDGEPWIAKYGMEPLALYEAQNAATNLMRDKEASGTWLVVLKGPVEDEELYRVTLAEGVVLTHVA
jgi:hypothetical protein